jgi:membrane-associated phospholipid phosphatase
MKRQLLSLLKRPKVTRRDIALTAVGALLWVGLTALRPYVIEARCAKNPELCAPAGVSAIDRYALGKNSGPAEDLSTDTQIFSGTWAYLVPLTFHAGRAMMASTPIGAALFLAGEDALLITEALVFNGSLNEVARLTVQRPRPYVYGDPAYYGSNLQNYTSFYSGHTSFSSVMNNSLLFTMMSRAAPMWLLILVGVAGQGVILITALTRILAGRHFFTDVFVGVLAGLIISLLVALTHREPSA